LSTVVVKLKAQPALGASPGGIVSTRAMETAPLNPVQLSPDTIRTVRTRHRQIETGRAMLTKRDTMARDTAAKTAGCTNPARPRARISAPIRRNRKRVDGVVDEGPKTCQTLSPGTPFHS
jgi:hypothetical protein